MSSRPVITILIPTTESRRRRLTRCLDAIRANAEWPHRILLYESQFEYAGEGCNRATLRAVDGISGLVYLSNDDMVMQPGCLRLLAEAYDDNLCYPDDTMFHGELATSWLCDADYFRRYFHEGYYHYCADNEMTEVSRLLGKLRYVPAAVSVHECMKTDPSLADSTYLANKLRLAEDKALFKARRKRNFDIPGHLIACGNGRGA